MDGPRILVTGGGGFIGSAVLRRLTKEGYDVVALTSGEPPVFDPAGVEWRRLNLLEAGEAEIADLVSEIGVTHCLHAAWYTNHSDYLTAGVNRDWLSASVRLAKGFYAAGGRRFVALGTCLEYDQKRGGGRFVEDRSPLGADTLYAQCKTELYAELGKLAAEHRTEMAWPRIFFVYGPGDRANRLLPYIIGNLAEGKPVTARFGGLRRDYIHVDDLAKQLTAILAGDVQGAVNTGVGKAVSIADIFRLAGARAKRPDLVEVNDEIDGPFGTLIEADVAKLDGAIGPLPVREIKDWLGPGKSVRDCWIGYGAYSADVSAPGDRRRFAAYAAQRGLSYELARTERRYDIAYITHHSDLPAWIARKKQEGDRLKLVFELIDSYLTRTGLIHRYVKGCARFLQGRESRLSPDFLKTLVEICTVADAVICSTQEQQEDIRHFNPNVFKSFDYFKDDISAPKENYERTGRLRLVWEGQAVTAGNIRLLSEPLKALKDKVELHVITDPSVPRFFNRFGRKPTIELLGDVGCPLILHPWERSSFSSLIASADVAIIPMNLRDPMIRGKPENKLVLLWQMGMPVLASPTPAYRRVMERAGFEMLCHDDRDWIVALEKLAEASPADLRAIGIRARDFAGEHYSEKLFREAYDAVFEHLGFRLDSPVEVESQSDLRPQATQ